MTDLENMLIYAARYAHGRKTGAALQVVNCAIKNWGDLSENIRKQLCNEAANEAQYCKEDWQRLIDHFNGDWGCE